MADDSISVVLRFPSVVLSRREFEDRVGQILDRYETRDGIVHYAQINIPESKSWKDIAAAIERIGLSVSKSIASNDIGRPTADFCTFVSGASSSFAIPNEVVATIANAGFNIEISTYAAS